MATCDALAAPRAVRAAAMTICERRHVLINEEEK